MYCTQLWKKMNDICKNQWIYDENQLNLNPSRRDGIRIHEEMSLREQGTNTIKEIAESLKLKRICMSTAIVYFHRFFMIRSLKHFDIRQISVCCLFLASKFEEQPIRMDHIIKESLKLCQKSKSEKITFKDLYERECNKLIENENEMLLTFGFDLCVIHPHTVIIHACNSSIIKREVSQKAYLIANDLLRLTTICLQYNHSFIACVCIYISSLLLNIPITATISSVNKNISNWCQLIESDIKMEEVVKVAENYSRYYYSWKPSVVAIKRSASFASISSPESAYSSGSSNSPTYETNDNQTNSYDITSCSSQKRFRSDLNSKVNNTSNGVKHLSISAALSQSKSNSTIHNSVSKDTKKVFNKSLVRNDLKMIDKYLTANPRKLITSKSSSTESVKPVKTVKSTKNFTITISNNIRTVRETSNCAELSVKIET